MRCELQPYRHANRFLVHWPHWHEFLALASTISITETERTQTEVLGGTPVGAQRAINVMFETLLTAEKGWVHQALVYKALDELPDRKMDFWKDYLGIEIAFNNDSYLERIVLRLNAANTTDPGMLDHEVAVGVVVVASQAIKSWGSMDPSVTTFEGARRTIALMQPSFTVPLMLVGLFPDQARAGPSPAFGKKKRTAL